MCGIAGSLNLPGAEGQQVISRMVRRMLDRGPDEQNVWASESGTANLGHSRLAILDLSPRGRQPMSTVDGRYTIAFNGEVYNYRVLRKRLESQGLEFRSDTDTEVILHLYQLYGPSCVDELRGIFAFAIYDSERQQLFLARDRLGVKPLYYYQDSEVLLFASVLRALLASGKVPRELDPAAISQYLTFGSTIEPSTIIRNVKLLPAGHWAMFENGAMKIHRYWHFDSRSQKVGSMDVDTIGGMLQESVQIELMSERPIGAFLSGGVDSSAIVSLMNRDRSQRIRTCSIGFSEAVYSEENLARQVANSFGTDHCQTTVTCSDLVAELPRIVDAMDQPTVDGINTYFVSKAARASGLTVALSGVGGDELFAGYSGFHRIPAILSRIQRLPVPLHGAARGVGSVMDFFGNLDHRFYRLGDLCRSESIADLYWVSRQVLPPKLVGRLTGLQPRYPDCAEYLDGAQDVVEAVSRLEMALYMRNTLLRDTDAMSMAHSLEVRVPLLDHLLVEAMLRLPGDQKLTPERPKKLLIDAVGDLSSTITQRAKMGFTFPMDIWLRGELRNFLEEQIRRAAFSGLVDPVVAMDLFKRFAAGRESYSRVWAIAVLELWVNAHVRSEVAI